MYYTQNWKYSDKKRLWLIIENQRKSKPEIEDSEMKNSKIEASKIENSKIEDYEIVDSEI